MVFIKQLSVDILKLSFKNVLEILEVSFQNFSFRNLILELDILDTEIEFIASVMTTGSFITSKSSAYKEVTGSWKIPL